MFSSLFLGGFECSTHCRPDGQRLDLLESTGHAARAADDYRQLGQFGISSVRDGLRWHLIEAQPGRYDWSSFEAMLKAAERTGVQVIWDLCHYGWPEHLDIWSTEFPASFARFAGNVARLVRDHSAPPRLYCPINEISYWAWAGGDVARINPCARGRGGELKAQLVRACMAGMDAVRAVDPEARFIHAEPLIHVVADPSRPRDRGRAESYRQAQWEVWDILSGKLRPELGGDNSYLDILGLNFYPDNQWYLDGSTIPCGHHDYRPLHEMLQEVFVRYKRPLLIAETGAEGSARPAWLHYVSQEVAAAREVDVPVLGICLYPILDYPGWSNERLCPVGLLGAAGDSTTRPIYQPLAQELQRQQQLALEQQCHGGISSRKSAVPPAASIRR
jgi:hypothetical protein